MFMVINNKNFYIKNKSNKKRKVYSFFGVRRKSYLGGVISRLYDYYCTGATNLYKEYRKYYYHEFLTFDDFLEKRYNLFKKEVVHISSKQVMMKDLSRDIDYNLYTLKEDESFVNGIRHFLGGQYED